MNSNHTDYNWNATAAQYDEAMLAEMDYYLAQIAATAGNPPAEQARYTADNWWWLWLYEHNRSPAQFSQLLDAISSEHLTVPLNPFVTLYGALPTEAVIRAGYYPGRIERQHGVEFPLAEAMENHTSPWGLSSIWAGSGVRYTWKGVCGCTGGSPIRSDDELFFWQGPDDKTLLFKWYELLADNTDWGGYSEARANLSSPSQLDAAIARTQVRMPGISFTGLFGAGWDDVSWMTTVVVDAVTAYNATATGDTAVVSNGVDFFQALEASGQTSLLDTLRGGWGNHWDMWPASLAERTSRTRRAFERMRTAEALAAWAQIQDSAFWPPLRASLEQGLVSAWKFFEHGWSVAPGGPGLSQMQADKESWSQDLENAVDGAIAAAEAALASRFDTPDEDWVAVFNPLGFVRTDIAETAAPGAGPFFVVDVDSGLEMPSQLVSRGGSSFLRFLARDVPSLGYRVFRIESELPQPLPDAAVVTTGTQTIENDRYRVVLGNRGQIIDATDKAPNPDVELAGADGLNDYGTGSVQGAFAENVGPVSATLRLDLTGPARSVRLTLFAEIDRIEIDNQILENQSGLHTYRFHAGLAGAQIRFEEIGAVARPGLEGQGGDFLPGTQANRMTLNHFADFALTDYHLVLSNWDAYAVQVNDSTDSSFDLTGDTLQVVVMEQTPGAGTSDQGGDDFFRNRFALRGIDGAFDGAEAMRTALAHQNPLHVLALPRNQEGSLSAPTASLLSSAAANVVLMAFKPAEDPGAGYVARFWELGGIPTGFDLDASGLGVAAAWHASLVETDIAPIAVAGNIVAATIEPWEIRTVRLVPTAIFADGFESGDTSAWSATVEQPRTQTH